MRLANVPPPMALHEIEVSSNIIDAAVMIRSDRHPSAVIGVLHHQGYSQFEWPLSSMAQNPPVCKFMHEYQSTNTGAIANRDRLYLHVYFSGNSSWLFSKSMEKSTFSIIGEDGEDIDQILLHETEIEGMVKYPWSSKSKKYIVLDHYGKTNSEELEMKIQLLDIVDVAGIELVLTPFSMQRIDAIVCDFKIEHAVNGLANVTGTPATRDVIFSLTESGSLFANERRLVRNCTSFLVTPAHLIFTTNQHLLKFVHMTGATEGEFPLTLSVALC